MEQKKILLVFLALTAIVFNSLAQVNLQTGAAQFNIPLYSYSDPANRLGTGVSLIYSAGNGLKVSDVAASTGTGWLLDIGGSITRIQHGEPDDQKQDEVFPYTYPNSTSPSGYIHYSLDYYPNGYMYSEFDPGVAVDNGGGYIPLFPPSTGVYRQLPVYITDREQDLFSFTFNGRQGSFIIGKNGVIKTINDSKLKIDKVITNMTGNSILTRISEFQIIDETGIKYVFKDLELSELISYESFGTTGISGMPNNYYDRLTSHPKGKYVVDKWFLSEIINPMTGKKITYTYESYDIDMPGNKSAYRSAADGKVNLTLTMERIKGKSKRIINIKCSEKEDIEFVYSTTFRKDLPFDKTLDEIRMKYANSTKYSWKMQYGYFVKSQLKANSDPFTQTEKNESRLCLLSVQKVGKNNTAEPPYSFGYYVGLCPFTENGVTTNLTFEVSPLFSFYQDYAGYPNQSFSVNNYLNDPAFDIDYANMDWTTIENYALNSFQIRNPLGINCMAGILRNVKNPYGGILGFEYGLNKIVATGTSEITTAGARVMKTTEYDAADHQKDIIKEYKYTRTDGLSSGWGYEAPDYHAVKAQRVYNCGSNYKPAQMVRQVVSHLPQTALSFYISSQMSQSAVTAPQGLIIQIVIAVLYQIFAPDHTDYTTDEWSTYSKSFSNPLPFQYSRVEVINKLSAGDIGKTVYEFTSNQDYAIDIPTLSVANSARPRYANWAYGMLKSISVYNNSLALVRKTENTYQLIKNTLTDNDYRSQKWLPNKFTYDCAVTPSSGLPATDIDHDTYYPFYGRIQITQSKDYLYDANNDFIVATTDYEYSSGNYQVNKVKTTNSKGELVEVASYYPDDYTLTGAIQTMKDNNIVGIPIARQTLITKGGSQKYMIDGSVSEFSTTGNGDIHVTKTYTPRMTDPVISSAVTFVPGQLLPSSTYYKETGNIAYNIVGLPVQINSDKGKASTIYDYNNKVPVAFAINADYTDIAYTSFEADGNGGWTFDPLKVAEEFCPTGKKCLKSTFGDGGTTISRDINSARKYILSFWKKGDNPVMTGATFTLVKSYSNTATGYTYYEYEITNGSSISLTGKTGTRLNTVYYIFNLDEIRLYPAEARMSTETFDPLVGKTADCDQNGRITYYEFDDLGRPKLVRDQDRNVIKTYEYNYKQ